MKKNFNHTFGRRMLSLAMVLLMAFPWVSAPALAAADWSELEISVSWTDGSQNTQSAMAVPLEWSENNAFWVQVTNDAPLDGLTLNITHPNHPDYGFAPGSGEVLTNVQNAQGLESNAVYITAFNGQQQADQYVLYVSTNVVPPEPKPVAVPVIYRAEENGNTLYETSVSVLPGESQDVQVDENQVSQDYELNDSSAKTASVNPDGSFQPVVFMFKLKPAEPVDVPVIYQAEDGSTLYETSVSVLPGESRDVQVDENKVSQDFELNDSSTKTATVNQDGSFQPVIFLFKLKPAEPVDVPVIYQAEDGSTLYETSVSVLPGDSRDVQVDVSQVSQDFELNDSSTKTASVNQDGSFQPVIFLFKLRPAEPVDVPVIYQAEDGTKLYETSVSVLPGDSRDVQVDVSQVSQDFELNDSSTKTASVNQDGSFQPIVFLFKLRPAEPVDVPVIYQAEDGTKLYETSVSVLPGESQDVQVDVSQVSQDFELNDSSTKTAAVNQDGSFQPVVFLFKVKPLEAVNVPVIYQAEDGTKLYETSVSVLPGESQDVQVDVNQVSQDFELNDSSTKTAAVNQDGSFQPVVFLFKVKPLEAVNVPVIYQAEDGTKLYETSVSVLPGESRDVQVDVNQVSQEFELNDSSTKTAAVNQDGSFQPVVFLFKLKPLEAVDVPVIYQAEDGTKLYETSVSVLPGETRDVQVDVNQVSQDFELNDSTIKTAAVNQDGSFQPVVFLFKLKPLEAVDVPVIYQAEDGTKLYETSVSVLPGETRDVQVDVNQVSQDFELNDSTVKTAAVNQDGSFQPVVFLFKLKPLAAVDVPVIYQAGDGTKLYETSVSVLPGESRDVQVDVNQVSQDFELNDSNVKTAAVNQDGSFQPVIFLFKEKPGEQPVTMVEIPIKYLGENDTLIFQDKASVVPGSGADIQVDLTKAPGYVLNDESVKNVFVDGNGTPSVQEIIFRFILNAEPAEADITVVYQGTDGTSLRSNGSFHAVEGQPNRITPEQNKFENGYMLTGTGEYVITFANGEPNTRTVTFQYAPPAGPAETPIPVGSVIDRWGVTNDKVNFRSSPAKNSSNLIKSLAKGTHIWMYESQYNEANEVWTRVMVDGQDGYIMTEFVDMMTQAQSEQYQTTLPSPMPTRTPVPTNTNTPTETPTPTVTPTPSPTPLPGQYNGYALTNRQVALRIEVSNSDGSILATLPVNTLVEVVGQVYQNSEAWSLVETLDDLTGYVPDDALRRITPEEAQYYIDQYNEANPTPTPTPTPTPSPAPVQQHGYAATLGDNVPMRGQADPNSMLVNMLAKSVVVYVSGQEYLNGMAWHIVQYAGEWGYIRADQLRWLSQQETIDYLNSLNTPTPTPAATLPPMDENSPSSYGYVTKDGVNFRSSPGTGTRIRLLNKYAFALVTSSTKVDGKTWYKVNQSGTEGYISGDFFHVLTLAELEEFLQSPEYIQGSTDNNGNNNNNNGNNNGDPPTAPEDWNVDTWTNPNTGINTSYEPFDPYATPDPIPTASPSPTPEPLATFELPPTAPPVDTQSDSPNFILLGLGATLLVGIGGLYAYALHKSNQRKAAARAAQRRAAMQQNPQSGARPYARATNAPMVPPASGTQTRPAAPPPGTQRPQAPGSTSPYGQRPVPGQPAGYAQHPSVTRPAQPGDSPTARPGQQTSAFARPAAGTQPGTQTPAAYRPVQGNPAAPDAQSGTAQQGSTTRQPRTARHAGNPPADQTPPTDTSENL